MTLENIMMAFLYGGMGALMIKAIKNIITYERRQFHSMNEDMHERIQRAMRETLEREQRPGGRLHSRGGEVRIRPGEPVPIIYGTIAPAPPEPPPPRDQYGRTRPRFDNIARTPFPGVSIDRDMPQQSINEFLKEPEPPKAACTLSPGKRKIDLKT